MNNKQKIFFTAFLIFALSTSLVVYSQVEEGTSGSIEPNGDLAEINDATFVFHIFPEDVITISYILTVSEPILTSMHIRLQDSTIRFTATCFAPLGDCDDGIWTVPITANENHVVCALWNVGDIDNNDPVVFINGIKQTVTIVSDPDGAANQVPGNFWVGSLVGASDLIGRISEVAVARENIGEPACENISGSRIKGMIQQYVSPDKLDYWPMDDIGDGVEDANTLLRNMGGGADLIALNTIGFGENWMSYGGGYG